MTKAALTTWFLATTLQLLVLFWNQSAVVALVALPQRLLPLPRRLDRPSIPTRRLHNGDDLYLSLGMTSSKASKNDDCSDSSPLAFSSNGVVGTTDITSDTIAWSLPPLLSVAALVSYDSTRKLFHSFIDAASGHTWAAADGGKYMAELIRPLLNGPVTFSVSILFGTLVAMTIQTLYNRQETIHKSLVTCTEEIRQLSLFVNGFPEPYERQAKLLVESFVSINVQELSEGNLTPDSLRSQTEMESLVLLLNKLSSDSHITRQPASLGQAYGCIQRIQAVRTELMATLYSVFSSAHYVTICILACTLLFVFLLETDQEAMQFLVGFQLSLCWSLLIGTYSMLGVIIFDLSTPFTGVFSVMKGTEGDLELASAYALAKDRLLTNDPTD